MSQKNYIMIKSYCECEMCELYNDNINFSGKHFYNITNSFMILFKCMIMNHTHVKVLSEFDSNVSFIKNYISNLDIDKASQEKVKNDIDTMLRILKSKLY